MHKNQLSHQRNLIERISDSVVNENNKPSKGQNIFFQKIFFFFIELSKKFDYTLSDRKKIKIMIAITLSMVQKFCVGFTVYSLSSLTQRYLLPKQKDSVLKISSGILGFLAVLVIFWLERNPIKTPSDFFALHKMLKKDFFNRPEWQEIIFDQNFFSLLQEFDITDNFLSEWVSENSAPLDMTIGKKNIKKGDQISCFDECLMRALQCTKEVIAEMKNEQNQEKNQRQENSFATSMNDQNFRYRDQTKIDNFQQNQIKQNLSETDLQNDDFEENIEYMQYSLKDWKKKFLKTIASEKKDGIKYLEDFQKYLHKLCIMEQKFYKNQKDIVAKNLKEILS